MANNKIFDRIKPSAKLERNGFPLDQRHTYTARAGMLYPVMSIDTVPNGFYEIDVASLTRTMPLVAPAYVRVKQFHHFFFVPYNALWRNYDNLISQRFDPTSVTQKVPLYAPSVNLGQLYSTYLQTPQTNIFGDNDKYGTRVIMEMLGFGDVDYNTRGDITDPSSSSASYAARYNTQRLNLWRPLAYQKIFYDYYRNHYRDNSVITRAFNVDDVECNNLTNSYIETYRTIEDVYTTIFKPQYRGWKKDIFMSSQTSQQFGDISILSSKFKLTNDIAFDSNLTTGLTNYNGYARLGLRNSTTGSAVAASTNWNADLFDVLQLRKAEKLQDWRQQTLLAGNRSLDQYEAHYGVKPFRENLHAQYLGGCDSIIAIDDVTQTTGYDISGDDNGLGEMAGKGIGTSNNNNVIKFHAKEFGVIMCIVSFVPELEYDGNIIDKGNTLIEPFDYFTPEFQNLGLEAIPRKSITGLAYPQSGQGFNETIGFSYHYWNYKTAVDKCHCEMSSLGVNRYYSTPRADLTISAIQSPNLNVRDFYINPKVLDSVFGYNISESGLTDQFRCVSNFTVKSVQPMSVVGIPQF